MEDDFYLQERLKMVAEQIRGRGIQQPEVLEAMRAIPRHLFIPRQYRALAYDDNPVPIGYGQTISQPYIVAYMSAALFLPPDAVVLEIGTGSGYQAAILGRMALQVYTIECVPELANRADILLDQLGITNVEVLTADGSKGLKEYAPYDGIIITAAAPEPPPPLLEQLADMACLVAPVGSRSYQELVRVQRRGEDYHTEKLVPVAFVPLTGEYGWQSHYWEE